MASGKAEAQPRVRADPLIGAVLSGGRWWRRAAQLGR